MCRNMDDARRYRSQVDLSQENTSLTQLVLLTGENKKVLEVGPATGYVTRILQERGCGVTCVEIDPEAAAEAEPFCERMIVGDIQTLDMAETFGDERFDVMMFGDVLEHLVDPAAVLIKIREYLSPQGYIVASIPNIAHGSIRLSLLRGEFRYTELGLLDRTHLRFFNRQTIEQLFSDSGYQIDTWRPIKGDPFHTELELSEDDFPPYLRESIKSDPDAMVYQFVVIAKPRASGETRNVVSGPTSRNGIALKGFWEIDEELHAKDRRIGELLSEQEATTARIESLLHNIDTLERRIERKQGELDGLYSRIREIETSTGWRMLNRVRPVLRRVAPMGSPQRKVLLGGGRAVYHFARRLAAPLRRGRPAMSPQDVSRSAKPRVARLRVAGYGEHCWTVGGGTVHALQLLIPLAEYYDVDLLLPPGTPPRDRKWYLENLLIDIGDIKVRHYKPGAETEYDVWLSVWNERIWESPVRKRFNMVFFPFVKLDGGGWTHITKSEYSRRHVKESYGTDDIIVAYPTVNAHEYRTGPKEPTILHVSRFALPSAYADKAHVMMIQAFKRLCERGLTGWKLILAGATLDEGESTYLHHLAKHAHGYPIEFAANLSASELRDLFARASVYWHATGFSVREPAAQEHFGITIVEGMASGAVPVSFNSGGPPEIITSGENGYLFNTLEEMVEHTWNLTHDAAHWRQLSDAARERAKFFSPDMVRTQMLEAVSKTSKVSIIMGTHNNVEVLRRAVPSILEMTPPGYELIVVDNNSSDGTSTYLASVDYPHLKIVTNPDNPGFAVFNNRGLQHATREYILYLNDDIEALPGWIEPLIETLDADQRIGAVGSRLFYPDGRVQHDGKMFAAEDLSPKHINMGGRAVREEEPIEVDALTAACILVRRELAGFSEDYKRGYYEDTDLCLRIKDSGHALVLHRGSVLIHYHGMSFGRDQKASEESQAANRKIFLQRWAKRIPELAYLASAEEMERTEIRCKPVMPPDELDPWPVSRRLGR
jgi:GT2 family glycosyltransferase/glycosyltransferase involved in cell wall biosynthesis/2-polyprenyl-3-methyl-5-hydroxy-6-metoxy-1,4-benzoquinol methylase